MAPFSWTGGDASTDFTNTVSWDSDGLTEERLLTYDDLAEWAAGSGLVASSEPLRRKAERDRGRAAALLAAALDLRLTLHELFVARAQFVPPPAGAVRKLDRWVAQATAHLRLTRGDEGLRWSWNDDRDLAAPLRRVAHAAALLLTGEDAARIKLCGNSECGWVFVDRSRRGNRRWCEMTACGSRDKARRYYRRHATLAATR